MFCFMFCFMLSYALFSAPLSPNALCYVVRYALCHADVFLVPVLFVSSAVILSHVAVASGHVGGTFSHVNVTPPYTVPGEVHYEGFRS